MYVIFFTVCLIACFLGSISGLSGGVIIKPVLDTFGIMSVSEISFLSGCTALTMSIVFLTKSKGKWSLINVKIPVFLGIGAAIGGIFGKYIFEFFKEFLKNDSKLGLIQSILLFLINLCIYLYIKNKSKIKSYTVNNLLVCLILGSILGIISSFLGIGGGPLNLALIYILFSMTPKQATLCSIVIIFFSQSASFITSIIKGLPSIDYIILIAMCSGAIIGASIGSNFSKKMNNEKIENLFIKILIFLIILNAYNIIKFSINF